MKYEVLKPFSLNPGRSEMADVGTLVVVRDESRAKDLQRNGLIAAEGEKLTKAETEAADEAEAPAEVTDVTHKTLTHAPSNKDAAAQRKTK